MTADTALFLIVSLMLLMDSIWCRYQVLARDKLYATTYESWTASVEAIRKDRDRVQVENEKLIDLVCELRKL